MRVANTPPLLYLVKNRVDASSAAFEAGHVQNALVWRFFLVFFSRNRGPAASSQDSRAGSRGQSSEDGDARRGAAGSGGGVQGCEPLVILRRGGGRGGPGW